MCAECVVSAFEILVTGPAQSLDSGLPLRARLQKYSGFAERPAAQHYRETSLGLTPNKTRCWVQTRAANLAYENVSYVSRMVRTDEEMETLFALSPTHYNAFCLLLVLAVPRGISLQAQSKCPTPPKYKLLRQDEDYSYLRDDACKLDRWDFLKYVRLGSSDDSFLTVGAEAREWYEGFRNANWGVGPQDDNGYLLQRLSAYGDFHVNPHIRFFAQLTSAIEVGRNGGPRPVIDESKLWFEQAFADVTLEKGADEKENSLIMRLGRQEFLFRNGPAGGRQRGTQCSPSVRWNRSHMEKGFVGRARVRHEACAERDGFLRRATGAWHDLLGSIRCPVQVEGREHSGKEH
jgi:hypothetical protein